MNHTVLLYRIYRWIHLSARAVKVSSVDVNAQGFSTHLLGVNTSGEGKPVVSMDNVKLLSASHLPGND